MWRDLFEPIGGSGSELLLCRSDAPFGECAEAEARSGKRGSPCAAIVMSLNKANPLVQASRRKARCSEPNRGFAKADVDRRPLPRASGPNVACTQRVAAWPPELAFQFASERTESSQFWFISWPSQGPSQRPPSGVPAGCQPREGCGIDVHLPVSTTFVRFANKKWFILGLFN